MHISEMFPSRFLSASDLPKGRTVEVDIEDVQMVAMDDEGGNTFKPAVSFVGKQKQLVLNRTNAEVLARVFGPDSDDWLGKKVFLFVDQTDFRGKRVDCLRLKVAPHQPVSHPPAAPERLDEIPF